MLYDQYFIDDLKNRADLVRRRSHNSGAEAMKVALAMWILFFVAPCLAQVPTEPALVENIPDSMSCDGMKTPIDNFVLEMQKHPEATGLIVITPDERNPVTALRFSMELREAIVFIKRFGAHHPVLKFANSGKNGTTAALFNLDNGKGAPTIALTDQPVLRNPPKRFFYNTTFSEACSTIKPGQFAELLLTNPNLRTDIFVHDDSRQRRMRTANRWVRTLTKNYKIDPHRIRLHLRKEDHSTGWSTPYAAFWITS